MASDVDSEFSAVEIIGGDAIQGVWPVEPGEGAQLAEAMEAPANVPDAPGEGFAIDAADLPLEGGEDPAFGNVHWRTLVCGERTPSSGLVLGVAEFEPHGTLEPHRHGPAEVYFGLEGTGIVTVEGVAHEIRPGVAVYVPPEAEHGTIAGPEGLKFAYSFPTARFADVDYRFTHR
ncbi:MAG: cupin domain-containing protein [Pseudomonadota bacterium]